MRYLSLLEKLQLLSSELMKNEIISISLIIMFVLTVMLTIKKLNVKKYSLAMILVFISTLTICIISNFKVLSKTFDNFMTNFLGGIYFPSIYAYIGMFLITFIFFIISITKVMTKKIYKIINSIAFVINNILLILILNIIANNNIDVFSISSLYTNNTLVAILELNMGLFVVWIFALITSFITNTICDTLALKKVSVKSSDVVEEIEVVKPIEEVIPSINDKVEVYDTIKEVEVPTTIENISANTTDGVTFNDILNGLVPVTYYDDNNINNCYNISNPQEIYEDNYNRVKENTIISIKPEIEEVKIIPEKEEIIPEVIMSVEDYTSKIKEERVKNNLINDTVSLNDLIKEDKEIEFNNMVIDTVKNDTYTLEDYKKITKMLKDIKNNSSSNNITLDDALTISLINNYSIDECVKFKEILESNFN